MDQDANQSGRDLARAWGAGGLKTMDTEEREKLARRAETSEKAL